MIELTKGKLLAGYEIIERIGRGGMGDVYKAKQASLNRIVALKVLPPELSRNKEFSERFDSEAKVISLLEHQNIVSIYDFGEQSNLRYFAMQFVEGESLDAKIERNKRLEAPVVLEIGKQILRALKYAHDRKVIHRDIKPHNILINQRGKVFVSDFGIAKLFANTRITHTGMTVGTPEYMSPEQSEGLPLNAQSDIYSFGVLLYEMLTGKPPFTAESPLAVAYKQINETPKSPFEYNAHIPQRLGMIILKALKKDPKERYKYTEDLLEDLDTIPVEADPKTQSIPVIKYTKRSEIDLDDRRITDRRMGDRRRGDRRGAYPKSEYIKILAIPITLLAISLGFLSYYLFFPPQEESRVTRLRMSASSTADPIGEESWAPKHIIDRDAATAWAEGATGYGANEYLLLSFKRPMTLTRIGIWNGFQKHTEGRQGDRFAMFSRLKTVEIQYSNGKSSILELSDRKGCQNFILPMSKTRYLRLAILDIYPGVRKDITCVSEVELWGMRAR